MPGPEMLGGVARPEPGLGRGAGLMLGDVTPGSMATAGVPRRNQVRVLGSNQQPSRQLRSLVRGVWTPHAWPFSGLAWSSRYSQSDPRARDARGHGKTRAWAGQRGGADAQGRDPGIMAPAVVPSRNQLRPLGSNQQSSRPLGRLLRGGWTPMRYPFRV